ncbi:MAG: hypothetical protein A3B91_00500 [Candidatus Yanofskybacteria bacterium RIFCSPHIGHO2_02_FULL_41_29]|uniref:Uncharacterized protein n=1 Tax=Candidatus Yanofskybacteria bacterium RIFCSPHIGHO2_01_FULL_41_53 TaxID=1802663 RepID=A0A1F8EEW0_9BACT|nr:MAG: hypothetical protein A2650_05125 [Candidatus Yanofskybacteria bacterium RIFCSPHIGHO2_01_FULL_41_53]OGN10460.1 MAG: hypothetical protein A3B91_00500 [Candidatus Yanofskybacteria bacterium RIFCSPHIGHO2_02_FULL_41_29]OGN17000.1 MAG: hypothetical protein A3F48_00450 [Candidatus Yanofskybacteria bacterium RIFCSPHIGHO2_12_FULL_41_9]OGN21408.1 MAG: hypothetical protein A2916_00060 [Candidatus Yanofskybacteria bacterium RIFCSPLOWO2_01_FULL_41_67]OGN29253.1 MAG: hypothetical protein A3H54_03715 
MIASTHLVAGAFSGLLVQKLLLENPNVIKGIGAGFCAGFASHLILDAIPHQDYGIEGYALGGILFVEVLAVFYLAFYSVHKAFTNWIIFFGMVGAAFPDLLGMVYEHGFRLGWLYNVDRLLHVFHSNPNAVYKIGILSQLILAIFMSLGARVRK